MMEKRVFFPFEEETNVVEDPMTGLLEAERLTQQNIAMASSIDFSSFYEER